MKRTSYILAAGDSTWASAHEQTVWAGSILHALFTKLESASLGTRSIGVACRPAGQESWPAGDVRVGTEVLGSHVQFEELLPAADLVMVSAAGPVTTLPIAVCMACAVPIVSTVTYTTAELLEDRHTALMCPKNKPRLLAGKAIALREDVKLQWALAIGPGPRRTSSFRKADFFRSTAGRMSRSPPAVSSAGSAPSRRLFRPANLPLPSAPPTDPFLWRRFCRGRAAASTRPCHS